MIVVFGSLNYDFVFAMERLPAAGETRLARTFAGAPGGKGGNQAVAAARDGADVHMVGCVGRDPLGDALITSLQRAGVMCRIERVDQPTGCASVCVDGAGENAIAVAQGANLALSATALPPDLVTANTTVLLQMEVAPDENWDVLRHAKASGARTILNVAPAGAVPADALDLTDVLIVNRIELETLARVLGLATAEPRALASEIARRHSLACIVTLGGHGVLAVDAGDVHALDAFAVDAIDTVGAGDTFCGVLAAALDRDVGLADALRRATVAAALCCTGRGAQPSIPTAGQTDEALLRDRRLAQADIHKAGDRSPL